MSLQNATIATGVTSITVTGGAAVTLSTDGQSVVGGIHLIDAAGTDFRTRLNLTCKNKNPALQSDGSWGMGKKSITVTKPKILSSGVQKFPNMRIELTDHPEMTPAEITALKELAVQAIWDADFTAFWSNGSLG